jgi:2-polyprenyl-3-methyl-5-hydroxy-6-metoxy-1,4-benzoquinol methylase
MRYLIDEIRQSRLRHFLESIPGHVRLRLKWTFFPGLDLYTRGRYRFLPRFFLEGNVKTLDAGCGNGALA